MPTNQIMQTGAVTQAQTLINNFQRSATTASQFYPHVIKAALIADLTQSVTAPASIDQAATSLCGPASFLYVLLGTRPDLYVQMVVELYQTGKARLGRLELEPSPGAGKRAVPANMRPVDWVALSGMMEGYFDPSQEAAGITFPGLLQGWFEQTGFNPVVERANITKMFLSTDKLIGRILEAQQAWESNYGVCLCVHTEAFLSTKVTAFDKFPNHWVVLTSPILIAQLNNNVLGNYQVINSAMIQRLKNDLNSGQLSANQLRIRFNVFSWGTDPIAVQGSTQTEAPLDYFLKHFFGFVKARWP